MQWKAFLDPVIRAFINENAQADVAALALKKLPDKNWPALLIFGQIKARQKAEKKIPQWLQYADIILPAGDVIEQASSAATALYKASLAEGGVFADLCAGAGVDSWALSNGFERGLSIDSDSDTAALIAHNMSFLAPGKIEVSCARAEDFVQTMPQVDLAYLDPQRRDNTRKGIYRLADCSPDIFALLPDLRRKAKRVMIKTSPMLDITKTLNDLPQVSAVHVLEWRGECKEVLYILDFDSEIAVDDIPVTAVTLDDKGVALHTIDFTTAGEKQACAVFAMPGAFLYEPGPAFQKAGGFNSIAEQFGVRKLHPHTHLYTSANPCTAFPGRHFVIEDTLPADSKALRGTQANLTIRNFPDNVENLKKKLGLKDGGNTYLFACTLADGRRALLRCRKAI